MLKPPRGSRNQTVLRISLVCLFCLVVLGSLVCSLCFSFFADFLVKIVACIRAANNKTFAGNSQSVEKTANRRLRAGETGLDQAYPRPELLS